MQRCVDFAEMGRLCRKSSGIHKGLIRKSQGIHKETIRKSQATQKEIIRDPYEIHEGFIMNPEGFQNECVSPLPFPSRTGSRIEISG